MTNWTRLRRSFSDLKPGVPLALAVLIAVGPASALADAKVWGTADAVSVEARQSSIAEILTALGNMFELRYRSPLKLDQPITGTYRGPLDRVVTRILQDYDIVVKVGRGGLDVTVIGARNAAAIAEASASSSGAQAPPPASSMPVSAPPNVTEARKSSQPIPASVPSELGEAQLSSFPALVLPNTHGSRASSSPPLPQVRSGPAAFPEPTKSDLQPYSPSAAFDGAAAFPAPSNAAIPTPVPTAVAPPG